MGGHVIVLEHGDCGEFEECIIFMKNLDNKAGFVWTSVDSTLMTQKSAVVPHGKLAFRFA